MIGLQWKPGKPAKGPRLGPVVISKGPSTPAVERSRPLYDPFAAYGSAMPDSPKRKRGRPPKVR